MFASPSDRPRAPDVQRPASGGRHALIVATAATRTPSCGSCARRPRRRAAGGRAARPGNGAFDVEVAVDEQQGTSRRRLDDFFPDRRPDDLLLLHFSCHGVKDDAARLFLAAADTEVDPPARPGSRPSRSTT